MAARPRNTADGLRSARRFGHDDLRRFGHRSRAMQMGYAPEDWTGKPIVNTWSDINPCHAHFRERADWVRRGILQAGGFPLELPAISLAGNFVRPTMMLYRDFLAMETEELIRSHPVGGAVLMGGCDKTLPGPVMGAISAGVPCIFLPAGPMLRGNWKGRVPGSGSDTWRFWDERRAGRISAREWTEIDGGIARSYGHCITMGTASTMTAIADTLGLCLPGASSVPAPDSGHQRMSAATGRRIVGMVWQDLTADLLVTEASVSNAAIVAMAMGCSTDAITHLIAMARRADVDLTLDATCLMASGGRMGDIVARAEAHDDVVIRTLATAIYDGGALAVLRGNLAPDGCVIKPSACAPHLSRHTGHALVWDDDEAMKRDTDDPGLDVTADHVPIFRGAGPLGGPGMPERGMLPIPVALVRQGVRDMLRISDARMSGTCYRACIPHVSPESHAGGPLAPVRTGDMVTVDVPVRRTDMDVDEAELARRRAGWTAPAPRYGRGYGWIFGRHILQAHEGCDFDFPETGFGAPVPEPEIH